MGAPPVSVPRGLSFGVGQIPQGSLFSLLPGKTSGLVASGAEQGRDIVGGRSILHPLFLGEQ